MAKILVMARDNINADPVVDLRGCYKKGYPVAMFPDDHSFGRSECPPTFIIIDCPEIPVAVARNYNNSWEKKIDFNLISANAATGTYQVEVFGSKTSVSGLGNVTRLQVENYLNNWGATVDSFATNSVTFTLALWQTLQSNGFWQRDVSAFGFTLDNYTNPIATVTIDSLPTVDAAKQAIAHQGGTVIGETTNTVTFTIDRSIVLGKFQDDLKEKVQTTLVRKQYYFSSGLVDQALAIVDTFDGQTQLTFKGVISLTQAEVLSDINNKLDE